MNRPAEPRAPSGQEVATGAASRDDAPLLASKTETIGRDADRYAQRQSQKLEGYRGGDVIVIGAGTLVIILIIVLLVLLLT